MDARITFVTLAVRDLAATRRFYVDGLGWQPAFEAPGEVIFVRVGAAVMLSLWDRAAFEAEVGGTASERGIPPITLAHNLPDVAGVDAVMADAAAAGGEIVVPAAHRSWGGYSGYFADPDGFRWEIAYNPGPLGVELMRDAGLA
ncbi:VOC family protein [Microbacterium radiodurans]|uniref:Glyoxalase n=1 Tax=Microbacterium radiodurans TaxID=661398 RepID=A0A5J5IMW2_9MICO|nr:VOC family protein [Microbacterium radiodurans]KAA9084943.1 glyoxalase [Microbacterium radiodurans]